MGSSAILVTPHDEYDGKGLIRRTGKFRSIAEISLLIA